MSTDNKNAADPLDGGDTTMAAQGTPKRANPDGGKQVFGIRTSYIWAFLFASVIVGWMASGQLAGGTAANSATVEKSTGQETVPQNQSNAPASKLFRVRVATVHAEPRDLQLILRGRTEANARVHVSAETAGTVIDVSADKGALAEKGQVLCSIDEGARRASLLEAEAQVQQAEADLAATSKLSQRGYAAELKVSADRARRDAARAAYERAKLDLARTAIKAPFSGIIEQQPAKVGNFLGIGQTCAMLVDVNPLLVVAAVAERDVSALSIGMPAQARLVTGDVVPAKLRYISSTSDAKTRTFRIELEVANSDLRLRDGITTDLVIPLQSKPAHKLPASILTLSDGGEIGVKIITGDNIVSFRPVNLLGDDGNGVWVDGLPETAKVITVGQEYVKDHQKVDPVDEPLSTAANARAGLN